VKLNMKWIEIIDLRTSGEFSEEVKQNLAAVVEEINPAVKFYMHAFMNTDFSIHIEHDSEKVDKNGSSLGIQIASNLKAFGLVNHNVWIESNLSEESHV